MATYVKLHTPISTGIMTCLTPILVRVEPPINKCVVIHLLIWDTLPSHNQPSDRAGTPPTHINASCAKHDASDRHEHLRCPQRRCMDLWCRRSPPGNNNINARHVLRCSVAPILRDADWRSHHGVGAHCNAHCVCMHCGVEVEVHHMRLTEGDVHIVDSELQ